MAGTALYAPAHRIANKSNLSPPGAGPNTAPSVDWGGSALQDPRLPYNLGGGSATGYGVLGWLGANRAKVTSAAPSLAAVANIAAGAHPASGVAMTLVSSTGAGITVVPAGGLVVYPALTTIPAGAVAIDGLAGITGFGTKSRTGLYDPTKMIARCVSVTGVSGGSGGAVTINGADVYGYTMTQTVTLAAGVNTVNTAKAFKFVTSVVPGFTDSSHNISVGTADVFGLNLAADYFSDVYILWNGVQALLATFTAAVTTSPATALTGDVRGTFTPPDASDGTKRLDIIVSPSLARIATSPQSTGLFGVAQA